MKQVKNVQIVAYNGGWLASGLVDGELKEIIYTKKVGIKEATKALSYK